jgi:hypothetical protein
VPTNQAGTDDNYIQIDVGYVPPADAEGPVTSNVVVTDPVILNGPATVTAKVDDSTKGGSNIESAEYSVNDGAWTAMSASDGAFDEVSEDVKATFTATEIGENTVCVRGTDVNDNLGASVCQAFMVIYNFQGFFSPVDNELKNLAKAGQAVPAKWRLTDYDGDPITDSESFSSLRTFAGCSESDVPSSTDAIEEYTGSSGLQNLGDGYFQFNWKTPKSYATAPSCRSMYVLFDSGQISPIVFFQFR